MSTVYIALGSNLGDREEHIKQAVIDIDNIEGCADVVCASIYETAPMGPQDQPDYLNSVCRCHCTLEPHVLLKELQLIEQQHGRSRTTARWTARTLDLDILLIDDKQIKDDVLLVPHAEIANRSFVLWPLSELDELLMVPGLGPVSELKQRCERLGIRRYDKGQSI